MRCKVSLILSVVLFFIFVNIALAHAPSEVSLSYVEEGEAVLIEIVHSSGTPAQHHVNRVDVFLNDELLVNESPEAMNDPVISIPLSDIDIEAGDTIAVRAYCNRGGDLQAQITIEE